jgi:hypothetical protein
MIFSFIHGDCHLLGVGLTGVVDRGIASHLKDRGSARTRDLARCQLAATKLDNRL